MPIFCLSSVDRKKINLFTMKTSSSPASGTSVVNVKSDKPTALKRKIFQ